jgi:hypothetical protein
MTEQRPDRPEQPRTEPEIIPPERGEQASSRRASAVWISVGPDGTQRVQFAKPGLLSLFLMALVLAALVAVILFVLFGAALILIPVIVLLFGVAAVVGLWQRLVSPRR